MGPEKISMLWRKEKKSASCQKSNSNSKDVQPVALSCLYSQIKSMPLRGIKIEGTAKSLTFAAAVKKKNYEMGT
jgi:hypothetical protein